ncbi:unnamed protein product [Urochloa humidicola]
MPAASGNTPWPRWNDMPSDLLEVISGHLHAATDYARFHAVCKPWRYSVPPAARRPTFLPWLLSPRDVETTGHRAARCVLSSTATADLHDRDRNWVIRAEDGVAFWILGGEESSGAGLVNPLAGSKATTLPPFPDEIASWVNHADTTGTISGDGTFLLYVFCLQALDSNGGVQIASNAAAGPFLSLNVALLRRPWKRGCMSLPVAT